MVFINAITRPDPLSLTKLGPNLQKHEEGGVGL
eukprot:COSAG06_NODE_39378_length_413_cov_0.968153_1_plen_32_part_10